MAIFHLSVKTIGRTAGRSATAAAAYRAGVEITDERTGEVHDYTKRGGVVSCELFLPEGAPEWAKERSSLWNAVEHSERRKNSTVAREFEVALPWELSEAQRSKLVADFSKELVEKHGIAVDACIHEPGKDGDSRNFHAHILTSTRRLGADGFGEKARELDAQETGPGLIQHWRERWAVLSNHALEQAGEEVRVDHRSNIDQSITLEPASHKGVHAVSMERRGIYGERITESQQVRQENAVKITARPELVLEKLTTTQAVFTRRDVARELNRYIDDREQFQAVLALIDGSSELVRLNSGDSAEARYSTRTMVRIETSMADRAERMASSGSHAAVDVESVIASKPGLSLEQRNAIRQIAGNGSLACVIGDAGTGKSFAMGVAREAWEKSGYRVIGAALSGKAAEGLQEGSGIESRTLASLEMAWKNAAENEGRSRASRRLASDSLRLDRNTVLVIDEAGMVGARQLSRICEMAEKAGAKVVLVGDDKQLSAIEAGAPFRSIVERNGAAEITDIRRQKAEWARAASQEFARGKLGVRVGLDAYNDRHMVHLEKSRGDACAAIAGAWLKGRGAGSSIILAHANTDVYQINRRVREVRYETGELSGGATFETERGTRTFAEGDRLLFLKNDSVLGVKNGTLGTVSKSSEGSLSVVLDSGRAVAVDQREYAGIDYGYAVTIHKAQGVTVDNAYVLATGGMDRSLTYVAMTRHRVAAQVFAGADDFKDYEALTRRLSRAQPKESTLDYLDYAQRRGDDRRSMLENGRSWLERAGERLRDVAARAGVALGRARRAFGLEGEVPVLGMPNNSLAGSATSAVPKEVSAGSIDDARSGALQRLRKEYREKGKNPLHHASEINRRADEAAIEWAKVNVAPDAVRKSKDRSEASDEETLEKLIADRAGERSGRAALLIAKLEKLDSQVSGAFRTHQAKRPNAPSAVSALLGGRKKYDRAVSEWEREGLAIGKRAGDVRRRMSRVVKVARDPLDARSLAVRKVARENPELLKRVDVIREARRLELLQKRKVARTEFEQKRDLDRGRSR